MATIIGPPPPPAAPAYEVRGTAPKDVKDPEQNTDIALGNAMATHVAQINSVRQAVWSRYTAMLVANSILFVFIGGAGAEPAQRVSAASYGMLLCVAWFVMLLRDWRLLLSLFAEANHFQWPLHGPTLNPVSALLAYEGRRLGRTIYILAFFVVLLFFYVHSTIFVPPAWTNFKLWLEGAGMCYFNIC